jgi:hypothetical protein
MHESGDRVKGSERLRFTTFPGQQWAKAGIHQSLFSMDPVLQRGDDSPKQVFKQRSKIRG